MLMQEILDILDQLRQDIPDFEALESLSPNLAADIAHWIDEDRKFLNAQAKIAVQKKRKV